MSREPKVQELQWYWAYWAPKGKVIVQFVPLEWAKRQQQEWICFCQLSDQTPWGSCILVWSTKSRGLCPHQEARVSQILMLWSLLCSHKESSLFPSFLLTLHVLPPSLPPLSKTILFVLLPCNITLTISAISLRHLSQIMWVDLKMGSSLRLGWKQLYWKFRKHGSGNWPEREREIDQSTLVVRMKNMSARMVDMYIY